MTQEVNVTKRAAEWLTPEGLDNVYNWAYAGLTEGDIGHNIGIHRNTLAKWKDMYSEFAKVVDEDKKPAVL